MNGSNDLSAFRSALKPSSGLFLTPLIDVVFLITIFFVLNTSFIKSSRIRLPQSDSGAVSGRQTTLVVGIASDGAVRLDGVPYSLSDFQKQLEARAKGTPLLIEGDKNISYQTLVSVLDRIQKAGITNINLAFKKK